MNELLQKKCAPCEGGTEPMTQEETEQYISNVPEWSLNDAGTAIQREFSFKGFKGALFFVNGVAAIAEREDHHPDISISYNKVQLTLTTHAIGGLSENDFILASKIDNLVL